VGIFYYAAHSLMTTTTSDPRINEGVQTFLNESATNISNHLNTSTIQNTTEFVNGAREEIALRLNESSSSGKTISLRQVRHLIAGFTAHVSAPHLGGLFSHKKTLAIAPPAEVKAIAPPPGGDELRAPAPAPQPKEPSNLNRQLTQHPTPAPHPALPKPAEVNTTKVFSEVVSKELGKGGQPIFKLTKNEKDDVAFFLFGEKGRKFSFTSFYGAPYKWKAAFQEKTLTFIARLVDLSKKNTLSKDEEIERNDLIATLGLTRDLYKNLPSNSNIWLNPENNKILEPHIENEKLYERVKSTMHDDTLANKIQGFFLEKYEEFRTIL
jgi:hypothetical protein